MTQLPFSVENKITCKIVTMSNYPSSVLYSCLTLQIGKNKLICSEIIRHVQVKCQKNMLYDISSIHVKSCGKYLICHFETYDVKSCGKYLICHFETYDIIRMSILKINFICLEKGKKTKKALPI